MAVPLGMEVRGRQLGKTELLKEKNVPTAIKLKGEG